MLHYTLSVYIMKPSPEVKALSFLESKASAEREFVKEIALPVMRGARDMLNESAKQFRQLNDAGHAAMCERHIQSLDEAIKRIEATSPECPVCASNVEAFKRMNAENP